jgi:urease accessory protein
MNFMPAAPPLTRPQRATGRLSLSFHAQNTQTKLKTFYQEGCLKARLPRPATETTADLITLNISGGIAGGDSLSTSLTLEPHTSLRLATQSAERIYRALDAPATITTTIHLAENTRLDHLPQETILFNAFALHRTLDIHLQESSSLLAVESLIFGRQSSGETIQSGHLRDRITLHKNGQKIWQDITRLDGNIAHHLSRPAIAGGATAMSCLIFHAPTAATYLTPLRTLLEASPLTAGATLLDGILIARLLAPTSQTLRKTLTAALKLLRDQDPLPTVWQG